MKTMKLVLCLALMMVPILKGQDEEQENPNEQQDEAGDQQGRQGFWEANLPGGNFVVALGRIISVSRHNYVLDGAVIVDEVTVDTEGQALTRFYFIKPLEASGGTGAAAGEAVKRLTDLADDTARKAGVNAQDMVVKKYPVTTHAKTVEYRLLSEEQLNSLYRSVKTAWQNGRGRVFTAR